MIAWLRDMLWPRRRAAELDAYEAAVREAVLVMERVRHRHWREAP